MTPEEREKLDELYAFMLARKEQQITTPLDDASQAILGTQNIIPGATDTTGLTQTYTDSRGDTVTAPKAYTAAISMTINGIVRRFPIL